MVAPLLALGDRIVASAAPTTQQIPWNMLLTPLGNPLIDGMLVLVVVTGAAMRATIPPDTPSFARRAPPPASSQLRKDPNAGLFSDRAGFGFSKRHWFVGTGCPPFRIGRKQLDLLRATSQDRPARVTQANGRTWWWLKDAFYWESGGYSDLDVLALLRDRERKEQRKLDRAHMLLKADQAPQQRREPVPREIRRAVFERDGGRCRQCGSNFDIQYDHVIPVALGGATTVDNLQILCGECNRDKGADL